MIYQEAGELCRMPKGHVCWSQCNPATDEHYVYDPQRLPMSNQGAYKQIRAEIFANVERSQSEAKRRLINVMLEADDMPDVPGQRLPAQAEVPVEMPERVWLQRFLDEPDEFPRFGGSYRKQPTVEIGHLIRPYDFITYVPESRAIAAEKALAEAEEVIQRLHEELLAAQHGGA